MESPPGWTGDYPTAGVSESVSPMKCVALRAVDALYIESLGVPG